MSIQRLDTCASLFVAYGDIAATRYDSQFHLAVALQKCFSHDDRIALKALMQSILSC